MALFRLLMELKHAAALRALNSTARWSLGRLRGARFRLPGVGQRGPVRGCAPFILMPNPVLRALGRHRRLLRRAVRHENLSLTARQSRDLLLIFGRVDVATTPPGLRPFCPLASPPEAPPKRVFNFRWMARATRLSLRELPSLTPLAQAISLRAA